MSMIDRRCPRCKKLRKFSPPHSRPKWRGWKMIDGEMTCGVCTGMQMDQDIGELLSRAWSFDDKPHLLFSHLMVMAKRYQTPDSREETVRLMDAAYESRPLQKAAHRLTRKRTEDGQ